MRPLFLVLAGFLLTLSPPVTARDIVVGSIHDLSGQLSPIGSHHAGLVRTFFEWIETEGGLGNDQNLVLIELDSGCNAEDAVRKAARIAAEPGLRLMIGPTCRIALEAMQKEIAGPSGIPVINATIAAESVSGLEERDNIMRWQVPHNLLSEQIAEWMNHKGHARVGIASDTSPVAAALQDRLIQHLQRKKIETIFVTDGSTVEPDLEPDALLTILTQANHDPAKPFTPQRIVSNIPNYIMWSPSGGPVAPDMPTHPALQTGTLLFTHRHDHADAVDAFLEWAETQGWTPDIPYSDVLFDSLFTLTLALEARSVRTIDELFATMDLVLEEGGVPILPGEWNKARASLRAGSRITYRPVSGEIEFDAYGDRFRELRLWQLDRAGEWQVWNGDDATTR